MNHSAAAGCRAAVAKIVRHIRQASTLTPMIRVRVPPEERQRSSVRAFALSIDRKDCTMSRRLSFTENRRRRLAKQLDQFRLEPRTTITEPISLTGLAISLDAAVACSLG